MIIFQNFTKILVWCGWIIGRFSFSKTNNGRKRESICINVWFFSSFLNDTASHINQPLQAFYVNFQSIFFLKLSKYLVQSKKRKQEFKFNNNILANKSISNMTRLNILQVMWNFEEILSLICNLCRKFLCLKKCVYEGYNILIICKVMIHNS